MPSPLTRTFRSSLPTSNGQRPIRSNFSSGLGNYQPTTPLAPPNASPEEALQSTAAAPTPPKRITPVSRPGAIGSPNRGGTITRNGITTTYAPSAGRTPNGPNRGGTLTRDLAPGVKAVTIVPPSPAAIQSPLTPALPANQPAALQPALPTPGAPAQSPTTTAQPQTESNNPLTGDTNDEPGGSTEDIDPGSALGLNRRGTSVPKGSDAVDENVGGSGLYARKFGNPKSAGIYSAYVRKIFGNAQS
jgi:hypothetical protein